MKHHFSKGGGQPEKKVDKKNKTSQIWKSGEASQQNLDKQKIFFFFTNKFKSGAGGASQKKNPVKLKTL
jgi:hypothetical protein